jgi:hypothetical protein
MTWWSVETCQSEVKISWNSEIVHLVCYNIAINSSIVQVLHPSSLLQIKRFITVLGTALSTVRSCVTSLGMLVFYVEQLSAPFPTHTLKNAALSGVRDYSVITSAAALTICMPLTPKHASRRAENEATRRWPKVAFIKTQNICYPEISEIILRF